MHLRNISFISQSDRKIFAKLKDPEILSLMSYIHRKYLAKRHKQNNALTQTRIGERER